MISFIALQHIRKIKWKNNANYTGKIGKRIEEK